MLDMRFFRKTRHPEIYAHAAQYSKQTAAQIAASRFPKNTKKDCYCVNLGRHKERPLRGGERHVSTTKKITPKQDNKNRCTTA